MTYSISRISPLGQGIAKDGSTTVFIGKTLPGETVQANIYKRKKQLAFAKLDTVINASQHRQKPECEHFYDCPGCHYLHTDYKHELQLKQQALADYGQRLGVVKNDIEVIASDKRLHYRNRVQLHYRHQYLGFIQSSQDQVLEVPHCQIIHPKLQQAFDQLYQDKSWAKTYQGRGHVELYYDGENVLQTWNQSYAAGGFSQVNQGINKQLNSQVLSILKTLQPSVLFDLFAGGGNLSNAYSDYCEVQGLPLTRKMLDVHGANTQPGFVQSNLFAKDALQRFKQKCAIKKADILLLDPPRKGFENLPQWVQAYKPKYLLYVSCDPVTLMRDIKNLPVKFTLKKIQLFDMFPGSYHFESLVLLELKNR